MPRAKKKSPRAKEMPEYFIFEIDVWEPYYIFSLNTDKYIEDSYSEHAGFEIKAHCVFPEKLKGRAATIRLASKRDGLVCAWEKNLPDMKLKGIARGHRASRRLWGCGRSLGYIKPYFGKS